jgi:hypothetical protein
MYEQLLLLMKRKKVPKHYDFDSSSVIKVASTQILNLTIISNIQMKHARFLVRGEILK